jgi:hypothetical protein
MIRLPSFKEELAPLPYAVLASALLLSQHLGVAIVFEAAGWRIIADAEFWFLPLRRLALLPDLPAWAAALAFASSLGVACGLAMLAFRRASWSRGGYVLAALTIVPAVQIAAVPLLALMPRLRSTTPTDRESGMNVAHVTQGMLAGVAIIVLAVLISAVTVGAYGWGLFVMTPFLVGVTTAYLTNRRTTMSPGRTTLLVLAAAGLGTLALVLLALEGVTCILLASPLGALVAAAGGALGRGAALMGSKRDTPLMSVAFLPALFALEGAMPPAVPIEMRETIDIAAPPRAVWSALIGSEPIDVRPGLVGQAGLAYPIAARLVRQGLGAERLGQFSTGTARERITAWTPGRRLAFVVLSQPPAMEEMSPYRRVHAPHVRGYFDTVETSFDLQPLRNGCTRLTAHATHVLRMDPVLYWEPVARWAIHLNVARVLSDIDAKAVKRAKADRLGFPSNAKPF